jgi:hypothetical protein
VLAIAVLATGCAPSVPRPDAADPPAGGSAQALPAPSRLRAEVLALLVRRSDAVLAGDLTAYWRTGSAAAQAPDPRRLAALPLTGWRYQVESITSEGGTSGLVHVRATLAYRLAGEPVDAVLPEQLSLAREHGGWVVAAEHATGARRALWEAGALQAVGGARSLVIGVGAAVPRGELVRWARLADRAVLGVAGVLPTGWTHRVTLVVPDSTSTLAALLGRDPAGLARLGAVTTAESSGPGTYRVWLNTPLMNQLSAVGRLVLLRHEVTHVATGAPASTATPLWLEEGLAEVVGYLGSGVPLTVVATDAITLVRHGRRPGTLPTVAELTAADPAAAYEQAYLACVLLVRQVGLAGLVRVYRRTAAGPDPDPAVNADRALRSVTGAGTASLTRSLQQLLLEVAG